MTKPIRNADDLAAAHQRLSEIQNDELESTEGSERSALEAEIARYLAIREQRMKKGQPEPD